MGWPRALFMAVLAICATCVLISLLSTCAVIVGTGFMVEGAKSAIEMIKAQEHK